VLILSGSASSKLGKSLSEHMGVPLVEREIKRFPDGECYVRITSDLTDQEVVIVQPTYPDNNIVELFALQEAVNEFSVKKTITVIPYYGYARQDKIFLKGETIVARNLAKHIELFTDEIILMDIHAPSIKDHFTKPCASISCMEQIGLYLKEFSPDAILAPDKGAIERAWNVSLALGCGFDHLEKTRIDGETVEIKAKNMDVSGQFVVIVDDIIATGGTIIKATEQLKAHGASKVWAACAHGLYTNNALPRLQDNVDNIISADTLECETSVVSCAPAIARVLKKGVEEYAAQGRPSTEDQ
jgi:ribose-phosphate pyrophosphokinase